MVLLEDRLDAYPPLRSTRRPSAAGACRCSRGMGEDDLQALILYKNTFIAVLYIDRKNNGFVAYYLSDPSMVSSMQSHRAVGRDRRGIQRGLAMEEGLEL